MRFYLTDVHMNVDTDKRIDTVMDTFVTDDVCLLQFRVEWEREFDSF